MKRRSGRKRAGEIAILEWVRVGARWRGEDFDVRVFLGSVERPMRR